MKFKAVYIEKYARFKKIGMGGGIEKASRLIKWKCFNYIKNLQYEQSAPPMITSGVRILNASFGEAVNCARNAEILNSTVGQRTSIGRYSKINYAKIGSFCSISWDVTIGALGHPYKNISGSASFFQKRFGIVDNDHGFKHQDTIVGNDVWIGCGAILLEGVRIGNGAIIGAGAIVTKDVPDYAIAVGNPAKVIKYRFEMDIRELLSEAKWWDYSLDELRKHAQLFMIEVVDKDVIKKLAGKKQ